VLYEVRTSEEESFELVSDEPLKVGELITESETVYEVTRVLDGNVVEVEWRAGPTGASDE
jgi:hypothetical protein